MEYQMDDNTKNTRASRPSLTVIEEYIPKEVHEKYRRLFLEYGGGTGLIRTSDITSIARDLGKKLSKQDVINILHGIDFCDTDTTAQEMFIDFAQFLAVISVITANCIPEDEMMKIFKVFDQDGDGLISPHELGKLMGKIGEPLSDEELCEMMKEADRDGDGFVSYKEFVRLMTNSHENTRNPASSATSGNPFVMTIGSEDENSISQSSSGTSCSSQIGEMEEDVPDILPFPREYPKDKPDKQFKKYKRRLSTFSSETLTKISTLKPGRKSCPNITPLTTITEPKPAVKVPRHTVGNFISSKYKLIRSKRHSY